MSEVFSGILSILLFFLLFILVQKGQEALAKLRNVDVLEARVAELERFVSCMAGYPVGASNSSIWGIDYEDSDDANLYLPRFTELEAGVSSLHNESEDLLRQIRLLQNAVSSLRADK